MVCYHVLQKEERGASSTVCVCARVSILAPAAPRTLRGLHTSYRSVCTRYKMSCDAHYFRISMGHSRAALSTPRLRDATGAVSVECNERGRGKRGGRGRQRYRQGGREKQPELDSSSELVVCHAQPRHVGNDTRPDVFITILVKRGSRLLKYSEQFYSLCTLSLKSFCSRPLSHSGCHATFDKNLPTSPIPLLPAL